MNTEEISMDLSIVVPAFCEGKNINMLYDRLVLVLKHLSKTFEIIIVDDGSNDDTWEVILSLNKIDENVKGIRLSRNFGHQYALLAGISSATGKAVITMDADLQHPPEIIPELLKQWENGNKIVNTIRIYSEHISLLKKTTSNIYYKIFAYLSGQDIKPGMADFRLLDKSVVKELITMRESGFFIRGIVHWMGFKNISVEFKSGDRTYGETKYTLKKMIEFAWIGLVSFSVIPLRLGIGLGILTSFFAFYQLMEALYAHFIEKSTIPGWTSTTVLMTLLFGILFILIGLIGEYISRILIELRNRPRFIISERTV